MPEETPVDVALAEPIPQTSECVSSVLTHTLSKYRYIYEKRLQNLVFRIDYNHAVEHGEPLTDARHFNYMYGTFSPEVHDSLRYTLNPPIESVKRDGKTITKYLCHTITPQQPTSYDVSHIEEVHNKTRRKPVEEIIQQNCQTTVYRTTEFGHQIDLSNNQIN